MSNTMKKILTTITLTAMSIPALAVLPTVTADPNMGMNTDVVTSQFQVAPATPIVLNAPTALPPMTATPIANPTSASMGQLQQRLLASLVSRDAMGNEVLSPITAQTRLSAGNIVEYRGYIINNSNERVRDAKVTFDLPANTELLGLADMSPARAMGSVDGVNFQYMPLKTNAGGVLQEIPMSSYKAVRWQIEGVGLNEVAEVKYRVRIK